MQRLTKKTDTVFKSEIKKTAENPNAVIDALKEMAKSEDKDYYVIGVTEVLTDDKEESRREEISSE